jgi:uncharacterized protein YjeT (DUF2065 family)
MRSQLVLALYLVTTLCLLVAGLTILFSPSAFRRITDRIARLDRFSTAKPDWNPGLNLQWRIMGGIVAGGALLMLWPVIRVVFFGVRHLPPAAAPGGGPGWYELAVGVAVVASGIFATLRPSVARWAVSTLPHREFTPEQVRRGFWPIRVSGVVLVVVGLTPVAFALQL